MHFQLILGNGQNSTSPYLSDSTISSFPSLTFSNSRRIIELPVSAKYDLYKPLHARHEITEKGLK